MCLNIKFFVIALAFLSLNIFSLSAITVGCTDSKATNYNAVATLNDGSCKYKETYTEPILLTQLTSEISETSGIFYHEGNLWTHNDSGDDAILYAIDMNSGEVIHRVVIANVPTVDWEDITLDDDYVYIGDIGNNSGNRKDLSIVKLPLSELMNDTAFATVMYFNYLDQTDFSSQPENNDFDAEAIVALGDSLYIFSKNWKNLKSRVYALPKSFEQYTASVVSILSINGLVTGADYSQEENAIILCGYNKLLQPFVYLLWDFNTPKMSEGNQRKINLNLPFHQVEGVAFNNLQKLYLTNEAIANKFMKINAALHELDASQWINSHIVEDGVLNFKDNKTINLFPNPSTDLLNIEWNISLKIFQIDIYDVNGKYSESWPVNDIDNSLQLDVSYLKKGAYLMKLLGKDEIHYKKFVKQ